MHLRAPSLDRDLVSVLWGLVFAVYVWAFMLGVGISLAMSVVVGAVVGGLVFALVRVYGSDEMSRPSRRRAG